MPYKLKNKIEITSPTLRTKSHFKAYKIHYIILISTVILLGILAFVLVKVFTPSSLKYPALSKEAFDALDFELEGKSYYEVVDIWDNPTEDPDLSSIKKHEINISVVNRLDKMIKLLQQADENLDQYLKAELEIINPYAKLSYLKMIESDLISSVRRCLEYFDKKLEVDDPLYIKKAKVYIGFFYSEHFLGKYYKYRKKLFEFLQKIKILNRENSGMVLMKKYKNLFGMAKEFMKGIYFEAPFYFSNVQKARDYLDNLKEDEEKHFIRKFEENLRVMLNYNYLYYLLTSYDFILVKENIRIKISGNFDRVFSPLGDSYTRIGLFRLEEALERWKTCGKGDDNFEEREKDVLNSFRRMGRIMNSY